MNNLVIDIKDGFIAVAFGGTEHVEYMKIDFDESYISGESNGPSTKGLFNLSGKRLEDLYAQTNKIILAVPMRFSLIKSLAVDQTGLSRYGDDFLQWEARQQIPEELGYFITGFKKVGESFDGKYSKYIFFAAPKDFTDVMINFAASGANVEVFPETEAAGLLNALNIAADSSGFVAAVSLEHDGASVVLARDGEFLGGRFIPGEPPDLGDEIMYYILGYAPEGLRPGLLVCGDHSIADNLGQLSWAEPLSVPEIFKLSNLPDDKNAGVFISAAGLILGGHQ